MPFIEIKNIYCETNFTKEINYAINRNTEFEIELIFEMFGTIISYELNIDCNHVIMEYSSNEECKNAIKKMDSFLYKGLKLSVTFLK